MTKRVRHLLTLIVWITLVALVVACGAPPDGKAPAKDLRIAPVGSVQAPEPARASGDSSQEEGPLPVLPDDAVRGLRNALVTMVLFSDFQCPFCGRLATTLDRLRELYGEEDLRIVFKNQPLPFHEHAKLAAEIGQAVLEKRGADAFWTYHDALFRRQRELVNPEGLRRAASAAGIDEMTLEAGLRSRAWSKKVERDMALAKAVDANGTPTMFVNGVVVSGAQPLDRIKEVVDAQLREAKALAKSGVPRGRVYRAAVATNYKAAGARKGDDDEDVEQPDASVWKVPVGNAPVRGKATALVTLVEFSDFQCPYCKRVEPTIEELRRIYGDKLRIVWKDEPLPFHPRAVPAANLARAARAQKGDAAFWDVHDRLFQSQPKLEDEDLEAVAKAAGLDVAKAMAAVKGSSHRVQMDADMELGDDVQASGTPHFFVNGRRLVGAQPLEKFKALVDEELAKAQALVKSGVAETAVYEATIKNGRGGFEPEKKTAAAPASAAPSRGPASAPVTIQLFSDFQCPFCGRVNQTIEDLLKAYPTKVRLVWRDHPLPMHPDAPLAAEAAREAFVQKGNDGFWKMHARLFGDQQNLKRQDLDEHARAIGLDMKKFAAALDGRTHKATIDAEVKVAEDGGLGGTPVFLVGPYYVSGAQPFVKFRRTIDKALGLPPGQTAAISGPSTPKPAAPVKPTVSPIPPPGAGLVVTDLAKGTGPGAKSGDKVEVHYTGTLTDGTVFDSSRTRGQPFSFTLGAGHVIKGWEQGVNGMQVGGKRKLVIPPDLAYGSRGAGNTIPPDATIEFEVELLGIGKP